MKINVNAPIEAKRHHFQDSALNHIAKTLDRFSNRISSVTITLTDENGPRGGVDQQCRISLVMPRFGEVVATSTHENRWTAFTQAADKVRRIVVTKLKRPKALRMRQTKDRHEPELELSSS
ncbi:HPF/RaiA family ribosome-associated protein [Thalassoglobus polymorphus]|uniref:Sigma 54 modulation protein / S30EA ribosomal protein n=1 Tax=Thalassoglobus polymorphus TaxID=2527994 RepID=A0A517QT06_9PLAN|nr:hypothetical protein [Thalassoglobus polymorphus]QDT34770.1 hypothetical protein Mal48_40420 [Thalassoglobus polymorphus]